MAALEDILVALERVLDDQEQVAFALRRISSFFTPGANLPEASESRASGLLDVLMILIKDKDDADLAMKRISKLFMSLAASSVTSQKSNSSQQATSSSSSPSAAQVATAPASAEAESNSPVKSEMPESPSTNSAVSTITQPQRSSASAQDTSPPPSAQAESPSSIESKVAKPSSTTAAVADVSQPQKSSASAQDAIPPPSVETKSTASFAPVVEFNSSKYWLSSASAPNTTSPPPTEAKSPAPAQSEVIPPSSTTTPTLPKTTQTQQIPASTTSPQPPPADPNGPLKTPGVDKPQQPVAPTTAPQPSSTPSSRPRYSADQLTPSPYSLQPTYKSAHDERVPPEVAKYVGKYQGPSYEVLLLLAQHGGRNFRPSGSEDGVPKFEKLDYYDYFQNERLMTVQRDKFKDHNGWQINIPRVTCNQYLDLYNSMIHRNPSDLDTICSAILSRLEIAIVYRAEVYKWYESLPPTDDRVEYNPRHLAFLQMFERLESAINRYLHSKNPQLIRR